MTSREFPVYYVMITVFRYGVPSSGRFQGDEGRQFCEVISWFFDANQVSSSLCLFLRNDPSAVPGHNAE